jgi:hypothetical protein
MSATAVIPSPLDIELANLAQYIPLRDAAASLRSERAGKRVHVATLYGWCERGCRGVRLRYIQIGATRATTQQWLADFFEALAVQSRGDTPAPTTPSAAPLAGRTPSQRRRALAEAERAFERLGG